MPRFEKKYIIDVAGFASIERKLSLLMRLDPHCADGPYTVRSLYFDSIGDDAVQDILGGMLNKQKIRLRTYDIAKGPFILEYKCRTGELGVKKKVELSRAEAWTLAQGRFDFLANQKDPVAAELYAQMSIDCCLPRAIVEYRRIAYVSDIANTRVTFDDEVRGSASTRDFLLPCPPLVPLARPGVGVLEVKYDGYLPSYIQEALAGLDETTRANSKYLLARLFSL